MEFLVKNPKSKSVKLLFQIALIGATIEFNSYFVIDIVTINNQFHVITKSEKDMKMTF